LDDADLEPALAGKLDNLPAVLIRRLSYVADRPTQANALYVYGGESGRILARVYREGTAGDQLLSGASHSASPAWVW
jgi:hypothetical protein